jgi:hypothetical protein
LGRHCGHIRRWHLRRNVPKGMLHISDGWHVRPTRSQRFSRLSFIHELPRIAEAALTPSDRTVGAVGVEHMCGQSSSGVRNQHEICREKAGYSHGLEHVAQSAGKDAVVGATLAVLASANRE